MNVEPATYTAPAGVDIERLEETLLEAFHALRDALAGGRPAIAVVRDADVLGHGDPAVPRSPTHSVGLVRALRRCGRKPSASREPTSRPPAALA